MAKNNSNLITRKLAMILLEQIRIIPNRKAKVIHHQSNDQLSEELGRSFEAKDKGVHAKN